MANKHPDWIDVTNLVTDAGIDPYHRRLMTKEKSGKTFFKMEVPDGAQIVGFTPEGKLVAIRETKEDTGEQYLHLPAGMVEEGETLNDAAAREFYEETGYSFNRLILVSTCNQSTPHLLGVDAVIVALGCKKMEEPKEKNISVVEMTPEQFERELCTYLTKDPARKGSGRNSLASLRLAMHVVNRDGLLNKPVTDASPKLIVIAGMPLAGKSTLGDALKAELNLPFCDIDRLREQVTGIPTREEYERRWATPGAEKEQELDMRIAYQTLHEGAVNAMLGNGRSVIVSATYSRKGSQKFLDALAKKYGAKVKVVLCAIANVTEEEIKRRMQRDDGKDKILGCATWADYQQIDVRYEPVTKTGVFPKESILEVDTGNPLETYLPQVLEFIRQ